MNADADGCVTAATQQPSLPGNTGQGPRPHGPDVPGSCFPPSSGAVRKPSIRILTSQPETPDSHVLKTHPIKVPEGMSLAKATWGCARWLGLPPPQPPPHTPRQGGL